MFWEFLHRLSVYSLPMALVAEDSAPRVPDVRLIATPPAPSLMLMPGVVFTMLDAQGRLIYSVLSKRAGLG